MGNGQAAAAAQSEAMVRQPLQLNPGRRESDAEILKQLALGFKQKQPDKDDNLTGDTESPLVGFLKKNVPEFQDLIQLGKSVEARQEKMNHSRISGDGKSSSTTPDQADESIIESDVDNNNTYIEDMSRSDLAAAEANEAHALREMLIATGRRLETNLANYENLKRTGARAFPLLLQRLRLVFDKADTSEETSSMFSENSLWIKIFNEHIKTLVDFQPNCILHKDGNKMQDYLECDHGNVTSEQGSTQRWPAVTKAHTEAALKAIENAILQMKVATGFSSIPERFL